MNKIKDDELLLLTFLRLNAREKLTKISRKTGIPVSTLFERLRDFQGKVIKKNVALVDFQALGYSIKAHISLKIKREDRYKLLEYLNRNRSVNSVYRINNGYDVLIEAIFRDIKEAEIFIDNIEENFTIKAKNVYYIIEEVQREEFFNSPEYVKLANLK